MTAAEALLAPRLEQRILPGLDRIRRALDVLGHPERRFRSVLVVGTNGKGSTAVLLATILRALGARVGLYTSPHLVELEERIRVDGAMIGRERLTELLHELARLPELSYFETLTAAAFLEFAARGVDVAVLEAGLGGRWDATNVVNPEVALLTNVGTDHQAWLGDTRAEIAAEKAAALRGREAIVASWDDEVEAVIRETATASRLTVASDWAETAAGQAVSSVGRLHPGQPVRFALAGHEGAAVLPLLGGHQLGNLRLALAAVAALARHGVAPAPEVSAVVRGIERARWPGRLQWAEWNGRRLLLDGAHNREAMEALAAALPTLAARPNLLFSCLADKPLEPMAALLRPVVADVVVAPLTSPRATPVPALVQAFPGCRPALSVPSALAMLSPDAPTLVTGSLRLVGDVLALVGGHDE